jgi:FlaA1/EpsC-like NDP-sugar epimerase
MLRMFGLSDDRSRPRGQKMRGLAFLHDVGMSAIAFLGALSLRIGMEDAYVNFMQYWQAFVLFVVLATIAGPLSGLNGGIWRYASLADMVAIVRTATITAGGFGLFLLIVDGFDSVPRSTPIIAWLLLIMLLAGPRMAYRLWRIHHAARRQSDSDRRNVLLIGAEDSAEAFIRATSERTDLPLRVVAVVDESGRRVGRFLRGVEVMGAIDDIPEIVDRLTWSGRDPQVIVISKSKHVIADHEIDRILDIAQSLNLDLVSAPDMGELIKGRDGQLTLAPVRIEDLLQRDPASLDLSGVKAMIKGHRVLVTGAGGSIGSELCRQIAALDPSDLALFEHSEFALYQVDAQLRELRPTLNLLPLIGDVRNRTDLERAFAQARPDIVFHAAALKHVPIVERQPVEGIRTNVLGTRNVADAALAFGAKAMVMISTDKAIHPTSVMGATKRLAEMYCQAADRRDRTRFITVRFGNVLGSTGSVVPLFERQLAAGGPLTVTHPDMQRYFMTIPEATQLVLQAARHGLAYPGQRGDIFVLDMGKPVKIVDLAKRMIRLRGLRPDIDIRIVFTGVRPGEKLFEELFDKSEPPSRTGTEGVLVAQPRHADLEAIDTALREMEAQIETGDGLGPLRVLKRLVPEYAADLAEDHDSRKGEVKLKLVASQSLPPAAQEPGLRAGS